MNDDITTARIGELTYERDIARLANRQLLKDLAEMKTELAQLRMERERLKVELQKAEGRKDD